jgi:hypothetical protein
MESLTLPLGNFFNLYSSHLEVKLAESFAHFERLLVLNLNHTSKDEPLDCMLLFTHLGKTCTNLKQLRLGNGIVFGVEQQLALVLGEDVDLIPISIKQQIIGCHSNMHCMQFRKVTPICQSLECIISSYTDSSNIAKFRSRVCGLAFLLRHLPRLQELSVGGVNSLDLSTCAYAVQLLHVISKFNVVIEEFSSSSFDRNLHWTINSKPPGKHLQLNIHFPLLLKYRTL